jgi:hypothetical protein
VNVFILNTGRCGSTTFIKACQHISNFSSAHESRCDLLGEARLAYPDNHIEADNRLAWFLGKLDQQYGNDAVYVHLKRDIHDTANSYARRQFGGGIIPAYRQGILQHLPKDTPDISVALDYCDTVNSNIELFLKDKTQKMTFKLENAKQDFKLFWDLIGASGELEMAVAEFDTAYNASSDPENSRLLSPGD